MHHLENESNHSSWLTRLGKLNEIRPAWPLAYTDWRITGLVFISLTRPKVPWSKCSVMFFFGSTSRLSSLMYVKIAKRYKNPDKILYIHATNTFMPKVRTCPQKTITRTHTKIYKVYMELYSENCKAMRFDLVITEHIDTLSCVLDRWSTASH